MLSRASWMPAVKFGRLPLYILFPMFSFPGNRKKIQFLNLDLQVFSLFLALKEAESALEDATFPLARGRCCKMTS
jgi:hypothetical protein